MILKLLALTVCIIGFVFIGPKAIDAFRQGGIRLEAVDVTLVAQRLLSA